MIYCDIDGTLTINGKIRNSEPILKRIEKLKELSKNKLIVIWSGNGYDYANNFKEKHNLINCIALGKPTVIIDDNPTIRPNWDKLIVKPDFLDK